MDTHRLYELEIARQMTASQARQHANKNVRGDEPSPFGLEANDISRVSRITAGLLCVFGVAATAAAVVS
jgi:hypothetical protein